MPPPSHARLQKKKAKLNAFDEELNTLRENTARVSAEMEAAQLELKKMVHKQERCTKEKKEAAALVDSILRHNDWIASEKAFFGKEGTNYEFKKGDKTRDPEKCRKRLSQLRDSQAKLEKNVNMKVLSMFDKAEKEYNELLKKKIIVEQDKEKVRGGG